MFMVEPATLRFLYAAVFHAAAVLLVVYLVALLISRALTRQSR